MLNCDRFGRIPHTLLAALLFGCAPAVRHNNPVDWPAQWDDRSLWSTPNAYIYAAQAAGAGEIDRLVERTRQQYLSDANGPTPRPVIIVRDAGEALPTNDVDALLRRALRFAAQREMSAQSDADGLEAAIDGAYTGVRMGAVACGTELEVVVAMIPLTCDVACLREVCNTPEELIGSIDLAIIIPTRACLHENARQMTRDALSCYGIGPAAQFLMAPVIAMAEAKTVNQMSVFREAALYNYWLFEHADLPWTEKQEIASAYLERWAGVAEGEASLVEAAASTADGGRSSDSHR